MPGDLANAKKTYLSFAAEWDEQISEGKSLSDREEAVLQGLEMMARNQTDNTWIKAGDLRDKVRQLLGYSPEQMGHAQWIGHILNRLQLSDRQHRKAYSGGQRYAVERGEVIDLICRYDVVVIEENNQ